MAKNEDPKKKALETASIIEDALRSIAGQVADIFDNAMAGADRVSQSVAKDIQKRFNQMAKVTDDIASNSNKLQRGLLKTKDVEEQILQRKIKQDALSTQLLTHLKQQGKEASNIEELIEKQNKGLISLNDEQKQLVEEFIKSKEYNQDYIEQLKEQLEGAQKLNKTVGVTGKLLKGLTKIPIVGQFLDTEKALNSSNKAAAEGASKVGAMGAAFKSLGKSLISSFTDPLTVMTSIVGIFLELDKAAGDFAKSQNMTYQDALKARESYSSMAASSGDMSLNAKDLMETQSAIGAQLGTNAKINDADLKTFTKLREQAGFTNEELMGIQQLSLVNGKSLEQNTKEILGGAKAYASRNKLVVNEKQVLREVSKASASLKLSLGGSTKAIAEAVVQAKKFGLTLEQTEKMSQSLLNFEDSIESELSAELLTGKDLNLERARGLALNGKTAEAAAEIAAQVGSSAEFGKMNVIQQEAIAKAVGMERNELAQSLIDKEALAKIGFKDAEAAKAKYEELRKTMTAEEAAAALGDAELAKQYEQQSNAEKFAKTIEHVKEILVSIVDGPMGKILSMMGDLLKDSKVVYGVFGALAVLLGGKMLISLTQTIAKLGAMVFKAAAYATAWAIANPVTALVGLGVAAGVGALVYSQMDDGVINPNGGMVVSGPEGSIQLNKKDSIIAGTNLGGGNNNNSNEIRELKNMVAAIASRPINVSIDGEKVIKATTGRYSNTQGDEVGKNSYKIQ